MNETVSLKKIGINTELEEGLTLGDIIDIKVQEALVDVGLTKDTSFNEAFKHLE